MSNNTLIESPILGKWEIVKAEGTAAAMNKGMIYTFEKDGNADTNGTKYKYSFENDLLLMDYEGEGDIVLQWNYSIDGDKMTLQNATDAHQKFWMEKRFS